jgi:hypothetical protein
MTATPCGLLLGIEDPEDPPSGQRLDAAVAVAASVREQLDAEGSPKNVLVTQRQSTGAYFPVALVESKSVTLLFDPGAPRLELTREGKRSLRQLGITI